MGKEKKAVYWSLLLLMYSPAAWAAEEHKYSVESLSLAGVKLNSTKLTDVPSLIGISSKQWHIGDAGDSESRICYQVSIEGHKYWLVFGSSGEMGDGKVTRIKLSEKPEAGASQSKCSAAKIDKDRLATRGGLGPLLPQEKLNGMFGRAAITKKNVLEYKHSGKEVLAKSNRFYEEFAKNQGCGWDSRGPFEDVNTQILVYLRSGQVVGFEISQIRSIC